MNKQNLFQNQFENNFKTFSLMALVFGIVGILGYAISYRTGNISYLYFFLLIGVVQNIIAYWYSGSLAIKYSGAIPADKSKPADARLIETVERLSKKANLPVPEVYVIPDQNLNAFATGRNKDHAKVAATQGLLNKLDQEELDGVIAHELSHIGNKDILISSVVAVMAGLITHLIYIFSTTSSDRENRANPLIGLLAMIFAPFAGLLIQMAVSRSREFQADAGSAAITENPNGLISALQKIEAYNIHPMSKVDESMAHMYIANPFGSTRSLFMSHPPVEERVAKLKNILL